MPIRSPNRGFTSLFQSPVQRTIPGLVSVVSPNAAIGTGVPRQAPLSSVDANAAGSICRPALAAAEARYGIPAGLLQAIGVVESGRRDQTTGTRQPWPWTINAEGVPHVFDTKEQAVAWVRQAQEGGMRSIDVGCSQVNLKHHPDAFVSLEQAFDPAVNADYAARFLKQLHDTSAGGNWMTAAGYYHSQTPDLAEGYRQMVQAVMARETPAIPSSPALASAPGPVPPFAVAGPMQPPIDRAAGPPRLSPTPSSRMGRGLDTYRAAPIQMVAMIRFNPPASDHGARSGIPGMAVGGLR
jgi:Transglycosylase SLT domain